MGLLNRRKTRTEVPMVNCKACGRPFPMPLMDQDDLEMTASHTHQCPYCGESADYFEADEINQE